MTLGYRMGGISDVAFAPKEAVLAAAGSNAVARVWTMDKVKETVDGPIGEACALLGGGLDAQEWNTWVAEDVKYRQTCGRPA